MPSTRRSEVTRSDVGIEAGAWASGVRARVPVSRQRVGRDVELSSGPSECEGGAVELLLRHFFLVEVSFADDEEVAGGVVARRGVANELRISQLVDVPVAVDADVIGDVDPPLRVLVIVLVLAEAGRRVGVVAEDDSGVVDRHAVEGVGRAARAGRPGAPGFPAQDHTRSGGANRRGGCNRRCWRWARHSAGRWDSAAAQAPIVATARPAVPAKRSNRRRLSS